MRTLVNRARTGAGRLVLTAGASLALAGGSLTIATLTSAADASAAPAHPAAAAHSAAGKSAVVVKEATRRHFGKILVTVHGGAALYYLPHGSCTGQCLAVWPRLVMPAGKTVPKGANCLGTAKFGKHGRQVTYRKERLYTFVDDSGHSVNGNGVSGFKVAKVHRSC